jgi:hypothetical protein
VYTAGQDPERMDVVTRPSQSRGGGCFRLLFAFPRPTALACRYANSGTDHIQVVRCKGCTRCIPISVEAVIGSVTVACPVCMERRSYIVSTEVFLGQPSWEVMRVLQGRR